MQNKIKVFSMNHRGKVSVENQVNNHMYDKVFDYGNLSCLTRFDGSHPAVMREWMDEFDWKPLLRFEGKRDTTNPIRNKHEKFNFEFRV